MIVPTVDRISGLKFQDLCNSELCSLTISWLSVPQSISFCYMLRFLAKACDCGNVTDRDRGEV